MSQSRRAESIRVCQPWPVARNPSTTSRERRMVMRSLVGAFCGPRTPPSFLLSDGGSAEKGLARAKSCSVHSGFSVSINSGLARLHEDQGMQATVEKAQRSDTALPVIPSDIFSEQGRLEIEVRRPLEGQPACLNVAGVLDGIERDLHLPYCMYLLMDSSSPLPAQD